MHDPTKVLLGSTQSSEKDISCEDGDPATFKAGLAVKRSSTGALSLSSGERIGVSLGRSLSDHKKTAVLRTGNRVPLQLTDEGVQAELEEADLTITAVADGAEGEEVSVEFLDTGTAGSEVVTVTDKKISVSMEDGVSTATQIKSKWDAKAEAVALATITISGTASDPQDAFAEANLDGGVEKYFYAVKGQPVEVSSTTGKAVSNGDATGAIYVETGLKGIDPIDASEVDVALIDMGGGL